MVCGIIFEPYITAIICQRRNFHACANCVVIRDETTSTQRQTV